MATMSWNAVEAKPVSVEDYLRTTYRPDCDFLDGVLEERNVGEIEHSRLQLKLSTIFLIHEAQWGVITLQECRLQVSARRFRIPDVMVLLSSQHETKIVRNAPLICIEILSPEDTWAKMRSRLNDYAGMGVEHTWCFDPQTREVRRYVANNFVIVSDPELSVPGTEIRLILTEVFSVLDRG